VGRVLAALVAVLRCTQRQIIRVANGLIGVREAREVHGVEPVNLDVEVTWIVPPRRELSLCTTTLDRRFAARAWLASLDFRQR
jgi:hypothetical protein